MNETIRLIDNRKSVRNFRDKAIGAEEVSAIIHSAMRAPTAGNEMLYTMLEVKSRQKKEKLAVTCDNQPFIAKAPLVIIFLADYQRMYDLFVHSGAVESGINRGIPERVPEPGDMLLAACDALIAAQNSVLAAESLGIGSCYIGDIIENYEIHREMFDLPDYVFPVTMLCYGYPEGDYVSRAPGPRFAEEYVHMTDSYVRFDSRELKEMPKPLTDIYFKSGKYFENARNYGEHLYFKKFTADFTVELNRSYKAALDLWSGKK